MTAETPGTGRLSVLITFADTPAPVSSSRVASNIEFAGSTVRSRNLAVPLRLLLLAIKGLLVTVAPGNGGWFPQPANAIKSIKPSSVHDAARHTLGVARFFHPVCAKRFAIFYFSIKELKIMLEEGLPVGRVVLWANSPSKALASMKKNRLVYKKCS